MTKEALKAYISEAVDALDPVDLELLFPVNNQPDLYTVVEELTGLKGAFNKLSGSTLKLNHEIHSLVEQVDSQQEQQEKFLLTLKEEEAAKTANEGEALDTDLKEILLKLLEMDEVLQLATISYQELPEPTWLTLNQFKVKLAAWQKGFDITLNRWGKFLQTTNLYKTGLAGEVFNPELHEAVAVKHQNELADNIILETEQAGFLYKGKVLKLAKVVVNKVKIIKVATPIPDKESTTISPTKIAEEIIVDKIESEETSKAIIEKTKPKPKRQKGKGGRRKKRKRKRS